MTNTSWLPPICALIGDEICYLDKCLIWELNLQHFLVYSPSSNQEPPFQGPDIYYLTICGTFWFFLISPYCTRLMLGIQMSEIISTSGGKVDIVNFATWSIIFDLTDCDSSVTAQKRSDKSCSKKLLPHLCCLIVTIK